MEFSYKKNQRMNDVLICCGYSYNLKTVSKAINQITKEPLTQRQNLMPSLITLTEPGSIMIHYFKCALGIISTTAALAKRNSKYLQIKRIILKLSIYYILKNK